MTTYANAIARARGIHGSDVHPVGRPKTGRVVHLHVGPTRVDAAGKVWARRGATPICGWAARPLAVLIDAQNVDGLFGWHISGHALCKRCAAAADRMPEQSTIPTDLTAVDVVLAAAAANTNAELLACLDASFTLDPLEPVEELRNHTGLELYGDVHGSDNDRTLEGRLTRICAGFYTEKRVA